MCDPLDLRVAIHEAPCSAEWRILWQRLLAPSSPKATPEVPLDEGATEQPKRKGAA
jgi:hypothetical protein